MFFILPHWWENEKKTSNFNKIFTFILILFQFYPQWKMLQVLYWGLWKKDLKWKEAKENLQRNVGSLEPLLESVPQVHILLCLWGQDRRLIDSPLFRVTLLTSVLSA